MKILFSSFLISFCFIAFAQKSISYFGEVTDSLRVPVQFANVLAIDTTTQEMAGFAVTDLDGQFKIRLEAKKAYLMKITFIGYAPFEVIVSPSETNKEPVLFQLSSQATNLGEVEVVAEMPVSFRGDTISYQVEVFTQGDERKLEDVLEDLPGFQIEENGDVKVQGQKVDKLLIGGKEFFNGDTKLATKNIPAGVVDRVQVLQNFNNISPLRNVNTSETLALNIELKEDKKKILFGDLTAGAGPSDRYIGHANAFYYDEKTNLNLIADANNIGELAFTMQDYFSFSGGLQSLMSRNGSNFSVSSDQVGIPMAERNTAQSLNNQLGAFNMSIQPGKNWQLSGFAIGSVVDNELGSISNRTYLQEAATLDETFSAETAVSNKSLLSKIALQYTPNLNLHIDYQAFGRTANMENQKQNVSIFNDFTNNLGGSTGQTPWSFQQKLSAYQAVGDKDVLSFAINHELQFQNPTYLLDATLRPYAQLIPWQETEDPYSLRQEREINTDKLEALVDYYHVLNRKNHLQFSLGYNQNNQTYNAQLFQEITDQQIAFDSTAFRNEASFNFSDLFAGILFKSKWKKLTWIPSVNLHYYQVDHDQLTNTGGFNRWLLLPSFSAKYQIRKSQKINFSYSLKANFMDIQSITSNLVVNGYNSLTTGNPTLVNSLAHVYNLRYSNFNTFTFFNIYGGVTYQRKKEDIQSSLSFNAIERFSLPINILPVNENIISYLNLEKRFNNFRLSLDSRWTYSQINNELAGIPNVNTNWQQQYVGAFSTRLWKKLNIKLSHSLNVNEYSGNQGSNTFLTKETSFNTRWQIHPNLSWKTTYAFTNYENQATNTTSTFDLLDSSLAYRKKGSPWEFTVKGMNLLDTRSIRRDSFSENLINTYAYFIQQRYSVFTIMYDI